MDHTAGVLVIAMLAACCSFCCGSRDRVLDVEQQFAEPLGTAQGQGQAQGATAPAPPSQAHTKEDILGVGVAYEAKLGPDDFEPCPPPYYPVSHPSESMNQ